MSMYYLNFYRIQCPRDAKILIDLPIAVKEKKKKKDLSSNAMFVLHVVILQIQLFDISVDTFYLF